MEISLPYGKGSKVMRTPPEVQVEFLAPRERDPIGNLEQAFADACGSPVGAPPLGETVGPGVRVAILVSDLTRSKGTEALLPICVEALRAGGVQRHSIKVLVARGTHRRLSKKEKEIFKNVTSGGVKFEEHDCDNPDKLSALMLTTRGTPVRINRVIRESDVVILLSPVSFHYFAGFGGGRKLILPGAADRAAILANHRLSLVDE